MKLVVDMNLSPDWIPYLAKVGFEAVHWSAIGAGDAPDKTIFDHARANGMIIFTHDLDFTTILALGRLHRPSLVQARVQDVSPESLGPSLVAALKQFAAELESGGRPERVRLRKVIFGRRGVQWPGKSNTVNWVDGAVAPRHGLVRDRWHGPQTSARVSRSALPRN